MGNCFGSTGDKERKKRTKEINKQLAVERTMLKNEVKLLLLGAGESGKSTILKQMRLIHDNGYTEEERESYREVIFSNTLQSIKVICEAMERLGINYGDEKTRLLGQLMRDSPLDYGSGEAPSELLRTTKILWGNSGVQECYRRSREFQLNDSAKYYFDSIDRLLSKDYVPTNQDILRARVKTTGVVEMKFHVGDLIYRMFDVGGQRSERKKWIHCFENVMAIIFLVAISAYDQVLFEDEKANRMEEALVLFGSICNSKWFVQTSMILFLNKIDIFKEKIKTSPIGDYFPDYSGGNDYEKATAYFSQKFRSLNQSSEKQVYVHLTCATDTNQIKFVMDAVSNIIIHDNLRQSGFI